jgi:hypothetical protein
MRRLMFRQWTAILIGCVLGFGVVAEAAPVSLQSIRITAGILVC